MLVETIKKAIKAKREKGFVVPEIFEEIIDEVEDKEMKEMADYYEREKAEDEKINNAIKEGLVNPEEAETWNDVERSNYVAHENLNQMLWDDTYDPEMI